MVMMGKPLCILGNGEVAFLRLGHLGGRDWFVVAQAPGRSGPRAGTRRVCICIHKPEDTSADAGSGRSGSTVRPKR